MKLKLDKAIFEEFSPEYNTGSDELDLIFHGTSAPVKCDENIINAPIGERFNKPQGGLWTSPYNLETGHAEWIDFCERECYDQEQMAKFSNCWHIVPDEDCRILVLNPDAPELKEYAIHDGTHLDFKAMSKKYDAVYIPMKTQDKFPNMFRSYDVNSCFFFRPKYQVMDHQQYATYLSKKTGNQISIRKEGKYSFSVINESYLKEKESAKLATKITERSLTAENTKILNHHFPSVADIKSVEKINVYHGSRNFFESYDYTKARTTGGAQFGLGQYFTPKESMAYGYATLDKENPIIEKGLETNGEKVATQKVVYQGEISGSDLSKILVPEKMNDADYDVLIETARKQGKNALAEELEKIKLTPTDRHIDLYQWLRKTESVDLMKSAGINGIYSPDRDVYAIYDTSKMNIKVKEAVVLNGTEIPKSLVADKSVIHIQESLVEKAENAHILSTKGSILQRTGKSEGAKITALIEPNASKQAFQTVEQTAEKAITAEVLKKQAAKSASRAKTAAKSVGQATKKTLLALNKAHDDAFDAIVKWGNKHAPEWMNRLEKATVQKAAESFMKTKSGQAMAKYIENKIGKEAATSIAKKIPGLCVALVVPSIVDRVKDGEYLKAFGEGAAVAAFMVPGPGTLAGIGITTAMLMDDLKVFEHGVMQGDPNSHMAAESTFVEKPEIRQEKLVRKVDNKVAEAKKNAESEKKAKKFEANLYKYGCNSGNFYGG